MSIKRSELLVLLVVMVVAMSAGQWLRGSRPAGSDEQGAALRAAVQPGELQMISSTTCAYCTKARLWLTEQQVPFDECFVETNAACRQRWLAVGAQATPTFVVGRSAVLGLDVPRLIELAQAQ